MGTRHEDYKMLNGKYLQDAECLLTEGDYSQASEKFWGAVAEAIKMVAASRGWRHFSHRELRDVTGRLSSETGDRDFVTLFNSAEALHANFYENWMDQVSVQVSADDARRLIEKLQPLAA